MNILVFITLIWGERNSIRVREARRSPTWEGKNRQSLKTWLPLHICMCVCKYMYMRIYMYMCIYLYMYIYTYTCVHVYVHICTCMCVCIYIYVNTQMHMCVWERETETESDPGPSSATPLKVHPYSELGSVEHNHSPNTRRSYGSLTIVTSSNPAAFRTSALLGHSFLFIFLQKNEAQVLVIEVGWNTSKGSITISPLVMEGLIRH